MSRLQALKDQNSKFDISIFDILNFLDRSNKKTYVEFLFKIIKNRKIDNYNIANIKDEICNTLEIPLSSLDSFNEFQLSFLFNTAGYFFSFSDIKLLNKFNKLREDGKMDGVDISKFKSFDDIRDQINIYELKSVGADLEKMTIKDFEDQEWLVVRPLTHLSSQKYGSNTKWCTTSEHSDHFDRYSKKGILIYNLNKITGYKAATFYSLDPYDRELSFWNQIDTRVDSMETELPQFILDKIKEIIKTEKETNYDKLGFEYKLDKIQTKIRYLSTTRALESIPVPEPPPVIIPDNHLNVSLFNENNTFSTTGYDEWSGDELSF